MARNHNEDRRLEGQAPREQFSTVHALRGFAALWVVLFHARNAGAFHNATMGRNGILSSILFDDGRGGVAIFFVLSGFVIAHSLWKAQLTGRRVVQFMVRRSFRLDPPYWASMALALAFAALRHGHNADLTASTPGIILANMFYLQELLRLPGIQVVYWTLTYEIQFYLVYALLLWWNARSKTLNLYPAIRVVPAILLVLAAFIGAAESNEWVPHGLFLNYWHAFAAGVLGYLGGFRRSNGALVLCLLLSATMLFSAPATQEVFNSPAAITAVGLALLGRFGKLSGLASAPFRALGTISYSLYLVHVPAIILFISLSTPLFSPSVAASSALFSIASYCFVVAGAIVSATAFWWVIERPSHAFAKRIRMRATARPVSTGLQAAP